MITATLNGKLTRDPEMKTSGKGTAYALLVLKVDVDLYARVNLFGDDLEQIGYLRKGDDVTAVGRLDVGLWESEKGKSGVSLSMMAHRLIAATMKQVRKH